MSAISTNLPKITHYQAIEPIYESDRTLVYRGRNEENGRAVTIKLMRNKYPSFNELVQFRNQYAIAKNLEIEGVVKSIALERYEKRYALILEDIGGVSLAEYTETTSLSILEFLNIAIQLADILHQLHQTNIIHKDIKPANILIHPDSQQVKLIDFSISTLLPKETQTIQTPRALEGTLAYLSPEQTGRMNRGIDYRSDFYSLGVTFYEILTGILPFTSDDPMELIHAHIAQSPEPIGKWVCLEGRLGPEPLSDIVSKLMAKNAEERYQSALGLKYDLEKCRAQYGETGKIESFQLGERDLCSRFNIPEKLYGRETEVQTLLDAFERVAVGNCEMILVAGFSGIGKTAAVNEVHKPIVRQRGYFIKGKFDQFNHNIPFFAFVQAFRNLMGQILSESDAELQGWKTKILEAVGTNGQVLIDVIPELESAIGKQPPAPELLGSAAQNRFNLLFEKFIAVFTTKEHPLVIFLDDLQWADSASLNLMKVLMGDSNRGYLLLLGAYRDNEVFPAHPLMLTLAELKKRRDPGSVSSAKRRAPRDLEAAISTITLTPLSEHHINQLVAETLTCNVEEAQPLTELVYQKTQGNPFFTTQFLVGLYEDELIVFNPNLGYWECDLVKVRDAALTDDVVEFMASRLQKLPEATQEVLKLAACIGNQFDLETLAIVRESASEKVASEIYHALQEGTIVPMSQAYKFFFGDLDSSPTETVTVNYRFLHDRVQQAAYSLIPEDQKQFAHWKIGTLLRDRTTNANIEDGIFDIVNQLNLGSELITQPEEKRQLAQLNFMAGKKAKTETAYSAAFEYAELARDLLPDNCWHHDYSLTRSIHELAAETAYLTGNFAKTEIFISLLLHNAADVLDKSKAYEVEIQVFIAQNQLLKAIQVALQYLSILGTDLPENPSELDIEQALLEVEEKLARDRVELLVSLPLMQDQKQLASMRILSSILNAAYVGLPNLLPIIVAKQVDLSITYGNMDVSPSAYANYGLILCGIVGDIDLGCHFGNLALDLLNTIQSKEFHAKTIEIVCLSVKHWKEHIDSTLDFFLNSYQLGLESGDFESASFAAYDYCAHSFVLGKNIVDLEREMLNYSAAIGKFQQEIIFKLNELHRQTLLNLMGENEDPLLLKGTAYDEEEMLPIHQQDDDFSSLALFYSDKLFLSYLFGQCDRAVDIATRGEGYLEGIPGQVFVPLFYWYDALSQLALYPNLNEIEEQKSAIARVVSHQTKMARWANYAPMNYQHKFDLVEAEKYRVFGQRLEAIELYDRAIAGAKENGYIQEEALANELFAKFYLDWGRTKEASVYMTDAYYCYAQWGAKAKINDLEERYPELLSPIRQPVRISYLPKFTISKTTKSSNLKTETITNISSIIDFSSLLKASQTLSGEIQLVPLLSTLMKIILENAGATKGALLLTSEQGLTIEAIANRNNDELQFDCLHQSIPLENYRDLPIGLINTVRRIAKTVLLDAKTAQTEFAADNYLRRVSPQSLLCLPLLERGNLIGILYLENTLTADAFTPDRVELLDALCAQAAISLTNARLYQQAQQALKDLQNAQLRLVQSEKMATLGDLVAGVAHEINNPLGFIGGNISVIQDYLKDLFTIIKGYQEEFPHPSFQLAENIEALELDFLLEDFPKTLASMQEGVDRIANISTSLRTFSRTDTDLKTEFNLHEGLDSTLLILKYRLNANEQRPAIDIIKNYGDIPLVKCYVGQLNQVFMNLLANAIDALDESNEGKTYEQLEKAPNCITISTELSEDNNRVIVKIADNGTGMTEEVRAKIFEQGFTTKEVGKGTGLGMAIALSIVEEKHGGSIASHSQLGKGTEFMICLPLKNFN